MIHVQVTESSVSAVRPTCCIWSYQAPLEVQLEPPQARLTVGTSRQSASLMGILLGLIFMKTLSHTYF